MGQSLYSEEEIKEMKNNTAQEESSKALPVPNEYIRFSDHVSMEDVKKSPTIYIIPECLPACEELWGKNIDTYWVSEAYAQSESPETHIIIEKKCLSKENLNIMLEIKKEGNVLQQNYGTWFKIEVPYVGEKARDELLKLAKRFKQQ